MVVGNSTCCKDLEGIKALDLLFSQLCPTLHVELIPGESDVNQESY